MTYDTAPKVAGRRSLAIWAGVAVLLVAFSYVFTLLLALACVWLPFLVLSTWPGFNSLVVFLAGIVVSLVILWSLVPRRDRFPVPGPRLHAAKHPRLFAELTKIAEALKEPLPLEVYLLPEMNAWVAERGGIMGFGSRRVMGLGLPLVGILTISEFRAVLAHEFGHYYGGDTRLWPWVHKTRAAMARTLMNLGSDSLAEALTRIHMARIVHHLAVAALVAYWSLFMRITQAISRLHEYRADELASNLAGTQALIDGLSTIHGASAALPLFWQTEMVPALEAGYRPSLTDGFARFLTVPGIATGVAKHVETELKEPVTDPYDTHPPLRDRIAALRNSVVCSDTVDLTPAISLFDMVEEVEVELLAAISQGLDVPSLRSVSWDQIGPDGYLPAWRALAQECGSLLENYTVERLPELVARLNEIAQRMRDPKGMLLTREQRTQRAAQLLWRALTVALCDQGWWLHATPGEFYLERAGERLAPAAVVTQIRSGAITANAWTKQCQSYGISEVSLMPSAR
jgi:Zn-dependent protease with chaperone function